MTLGSVLLLACMSSAASTAWVGGTGGWIEGRVAELMNRTSLLSTSGMIESALVYARRIVEEHEPEQDELWVRHMEQARAAREGGAPPLID